MNVLFAQPRSSAEPSFWMAIGGHKLNVVRLGEENIPVIGRMGIEGRPGGLRDDRVGTGAETPAVAAAAVIPTPVRLDEESLPVALLGENENDRSRTFVRNECMYVPTHIKCLNLIETFKSINKNAFLDDSATALLRTCGAFSGEAADDDEDGVDDDDDDDDDLSHLLTTVCLSHLDLKKHVYLYWFAFPSIIPRKGRAI